MTTGSGVQVDDGEFTRLHNTILEKLALARFTASEYRCLMYLFRATYGWQKKEDVISLSQWAAGTGIDPEKRHNALRTLQALTAKRVIYCKSNGNNHAATWGFNKHFDEWDASLFIESVISPDNSSDDESVMQDDNSSAPTVIKPDNRGVISRDNKTVISPDNHKRKKERLKKEEGEKAQAPAPTPKHNFFDPRKFIGGLVPTGTGTTPAEVFYEVHSLKDDSAVLSKHALATISEQVDDLARWRKVVSEWELSSFRATNIKGQLEWYVKGIPDRGGSSGSAASNGVQKNGYLSEAEKSKLVTRAKTARSSIRTAELVGGAIEPQWLQDIEVAKEHGLI